MMRGYYIHNQQKDESGVSKKIDAQVKVFAKHFHMCEIIIEKKKENIIAKKIRQKLLKRRPRLRYDIALGKIDGPDFIYIRKQILDEDFLKFLKTIKDEYLNCRILMEVPTYPYWNEYPHNNLGKKIIEEEKRIIPQLKDVIDFVVDVGNEKELFGIPTININNGVDPEQVNISNKIKKTDSINLIAVAKFREAHGYERIIESLTNYYQKGGHREVIFHIVGEGSELEYYEHIAKSEYCAKHVVFYGYRTGKELEDIYDLADIGLGFFGQYKTGGNYVSAIKCAEYLMRGLPVVSAVDEEYLLELSGKYYLSFPDDSSPIDMKSIIDFYDLVYKNNNDEVHKEIRKVAMDKVAIDKVMAPVIQLIYESNEKNNNKNM